MRVEPVETLIVVQTAVAVLAVLGLVGFVACTPGRAAIPVVAARSALETQDWLAARRMAAGRPGW